MPERSAPSIEFLENSSAGVAIHARLREVETFLQVCYENAPMMMGVIEARAQDFLFVSVNAATARFFGRTTEQVQGCLASQLDIPAERVQRWIHYCHKSERNSAPAQFEHCVLDGGRQKWLSVTICFLERNPGGPARFTFIVEDVTDRRLGAEARARLLKTVIAAQEEERRRLARDLHDGISQTLMSLIFRIRALENLQPLDQIKESVGAILNAVQTAASEVRHLARGLHPAVLDQLGLAAALERFVADFEKIHDLKVDIHFLNIAATRMPMAVEASLYRILQEALGNVAKHASAKSVSVVIEHRDIGVHVIVEDDGCGFDFAAASEGGQLGMSTMQERAALLNGSVIVDSRPGLGTSVSVFIPLEENSHDTDPNPARR